MAPRSTPGSPPARPPIDRKLTAKDEAFAAVELAYVEFRDLFLVLPDEAYSEIIAGEWDADRILAHMAGWYRELAPEVARIVAGTPTPFEQWLPEDEWNGRFAAAALHGAPALDDFDMAFHEFYAAMKAAPDEYFGTAPDGTHLPVRRLFLGLAIDHVAEHRADIEAWLSRR